jgi:hypothetical protein
MEKTSEQLTVLILIFGMDEFEHEDTKISLNQIEDELKLQK